MTFSLAAVYEQGVLRPLKPISLDEGAVVEIILIASPPTPDHLSSAALLAEIAALPDEGLTDPFSGRDHDQVLYGESRASQ